MTQALTVIKALGSWGCIVGAIALLILTKDISTAGTLGILSIAFSQAPNA